MILARATQSVIGFTDALLIAPLGQESLAAVTTGALNTFSFIILPMGTVFIVQSFAAQLRVGTVFMNRCDHVDPRLPWSGVRESGRGHSLSVLGFDQLVRTRSIHLKP